MKSPAGFEVEMIYSLEQPPQGKQLVNEYFLHLQGHHYCQQPLVPLCPRIIVLFVNSSDYYPILRLPL
jgi:hypothetical protein